MPVNDRVLSLYQDLLDKYGAPGPWPWFGRDRPHTPDEIVIGAILTQNTNWQNVEYAIENLRGENVCTIEDVYTLARRRLAWLKKLIRPSGFYNQKAERLYLFAKFMVEEYGGLENFFKLDTVLGRVKLLNLKGVGEETADTILLYAGGKPSFVVDGYTKRFVQEYRFFDAFDYSSLQNFFVRNLPQDVKIYQDYHALIVRWNKEKKM